MNSWTTSMWMPTMQTHINKFWYTKNSNQLIMLEPVSWINETQLHFNFLTNFEYQSVYVM